MSEIILIAGTIDLNPAKREFALDAAAPLMEKTRAQPGCLDYVWTADPLVAGRIYIFERWRSRADLQAHFAGPWYLAMRDAMQACGITAVNVAKYRIDFSEPVYDPEGRPRADFFTVD